MRTFQRYGFWVLGWAILLMTIIDFSITLHSTWKLIAMSDANNVVEYGVSLRSTLLGALVTSAIGFVCLFLARICKLESDASLKSDLNKIVARLRGDSVKTAVDAADAMER